MKKIKFLLKIVKEMVRRNKSIKVILARGSTAYGKIKNYGDIDLEIYTEKPKKLPYYKILNFNGKKVLLTVYFYRFKKGEEIKKRKISRNIRVLYGCYNSNLKPSFKKEKYNKKERTIRDKQLYLDFLFKYKRTKDKKLFSTIRKYKRKIGSKK